MQALFELGERMSADVLRLYRNGAPETLIANLAEIETDIEYMLVVRVMKDGAIRHDWSYIKNSLAALGAVETLRTVMLANCDE
jgi:hypothetical protein